MRIETSLGREPIVGISAAARRAEQWGFDGLGLPEVRQDPFLCAGLATTTTERIRLTSSVAIAFPRSPMVVAYLARDLQALSRDRFVLGLGTQVKGHIVRRFSVEWGSPGPRLREYIMSLRAIWDTWQHGTQLDFRGDFYAFTLMTPEFNLGPAEYPPIKIQIAAINTYNIRLAGELCDGLRVHGFTTPEYIRDVIWPNLRIGAARSRRSLDTFELIGGGFLATGATEAEVAAARETVRYRIGHYASTRTYLPVLEHHGWEAITPELRRLIDENRWSELGTLVSDEMLDTFCMSGTYDGIADAVAHRLGGLVDTVHFPLPQDDCADPDGIRAALARLRAIPGANREIDSVRVDAATS